MGNGVVSSLLVPNETANINPIHALCYESIDGCHSFIDSFNIGFNPLRLAHIELLNLL